jgi:hypothetical protein
MKILAKTAPAQAWRNSCRLASLAAGKSSQLWAALF